MEQGSLARRTDAARSSAAGCRDYRLQPQRTCALEHVMDMDRARIRPGTVERTRDEENRRMDVNAPHQSAGGRGSWRGVWCQCEAESSGNQRQCQCEGADLTRNSTL